MEIVVVDDRSTDSTSLIIEISASGYTRKQNSDQVVGPART
jgi:glycosyltransferase involved in cell wall biosynthesis